MLCFRSSPVELQKFLLEQVNQMQPEVRYLCVDQRLGLILRSSAQMRMTHLLLCRVCIHYYSFLQNWCLSHSFGFLTQFAKKKNPQKNNKDRFLWMDDGAQKSIFHTRITTCGPFATCPSMSLFPFLSYQNKD